MNEEGNRVAELEAELASYENPTCNGEWVGGSGGHRKFAGCGLPATWRDDGGACFCDHHLPQNERIAQLEDENSRLRHLVDSIDAVCKGHIDLTQEAKKRVAKLEHDLAKARAAIGPLGTPPLPNDPRLP